MHSPDWYGFYFPTILQAMRLHAMLKDSRRAATQNCLVPYAASTRFDSALRRRGQVSWMRGMINILLKRHRRKAWTHCSSLLPLGLFLGWISGCQCMRQSEVTKDLFCTSRPSLKRAVRKAVAYERRVRHKDIKLLDLEAYSLVSFRGTLEQSDVLKGSWIHVFPRGKGVGIF